MFLDFWLELWFYDKIYFLTKFRFLPKFRCFRKVRPLTKFRFFTKFRFLVKFLFLAIFRSLSEFYWPNFDLWPNRIFKFLFLTKFPCFSLPKIVIKFTFYVISIIFFSVYFLTKNKLTKKYFKQSIIFCFFFGKTQKKCKFKKLFRKNLKNVKKYYVTIVSCFYFFKNVVLFCNYKYQLNKMYLVNYIKNQNCKKCYIWPFYVIT